MNILRKGTAVTVPIGPFVATSDGYTAYTNSITAANIKLSKHNSGTAAQKSETNVAAHIAAGYMACPLNTTDTATVGSMRLFVAGSSSYLPVEENYQIVDTVVYDSLFAANGTDLLQVDVQAVASTVQRTQASYVLRRTLSSALSDTNVADAKSFRSLAGAVSKLVNKTTTLETGGKLTIYEPDDSTVLGRQALATNAAADPITELDTD